MSAWDRSGAGRSKPWRVPRLAGPIILSNLSLPLVGLVDTAVMGHLPDPRFLGGVALGAMLFSYIFWGFGFLRQTTGGLTAQAVGAGDEPRRAGILLRALTIAAGLALLLLLLQLPIAWLALSLVNASPEVEAEASRYFFIRIWSAPAALINYVVVGWLIGAGRTGRILTLQLLLNGTNIALDLLFVLGFGWQIAGVAAASLIAETLAAVAGLATIAAMLGSDGRRLLRQRLTDPAVFARDKFLALAAMNLDLFLRSLGLTTAFAVMTAKSAELGDLVLAANAILKQFLIFAAHGLDGFSDAAEILAGQAKGRRDRKRFLRDCLTATAWGAGMALAMALLYWLAGPLLLSAMTDLPEVRALAALYLPWLVALPPLAVWAFLLDGIFVGTTETRAMRNAMLAALALYLIALWALLPAYGNHGLWLAITLFMLLRAATLAVALPGLWRRLET